MDRKLGLIGLAIMLVLVITGLAGAWPVPDTGQIQCYTYDVNSDTWNEGPCPAPGEPYHGQDGNYLINAPSFTKLDAQRNDLADNSISWAMVQDNLTGLIWEVKQNMDGVKDYSNPHDADNTYTWYDSNPETNGGDTGTPNEFGRDTESFINDLNNSNYGGFSGWRLPTVKEMQTIINYGRQNLSVFEEYFQNTVSSLYWSSTTYASNTDIVWSEYRNLPEGEYGN
jgi:hypothetical protein